MSRGRGRTALAIVSAVAVALGFGLTSFSTGRPNRVVGYLSRISHGHYHAHFVINTAQNGRGPKRNPHPFHQGNEDLCNPPGRGLGRLPTGDVHPAFDGLDFANLDGFMWTGVPGRSHGSSCPGGSLEAAGGVRPQVRPGAGPGRRAAARSGLSQPALLVATEETVAMRGVSSTGGRGPGASPAPHGRAG